MLQADDAASVATGAMSAIVRNMPAADLASDSKFVQKLFRKIKRALTTRGSYGLVEISDSFKRLDRIVTREATEMGRSNITKARLNSYSGPKDSFSFADDYGLSGQRMPETPPNNGTCLVDGNTFKSYLFDGLTMEGVTVKEIEVLFFLMDTDEDGIVDMADVLLALRKLFHCTAQQFHDVLKKLRSKRPQVFGGGSPFRKRNGALPSRPPTREAIFLYLLKGSGAGGPFDLTESEVYLFLDYCSRACGIGPLINKTRAVVVLVSR